MSKFILLFMLHGCAIGHIDKNLVAGIAIGHAKLECCCEYDPTTFTEMGPNLPPMHCQTIQGGDLSTTFTGMISAMAIAVASIFTSGLVF